MQLDLTPPTSPNPTPPQPPLSLYLSSPPFPPRTRPPLLPAPQQVMGQPVLRPEQRRDRLLQGRQEHQRVLQQRAAAQPGPLPLRRHQRLQEEEECLYAKVRACFYSCTRYSLTLATLASKALASKALASKASTNVTAPSFVFENKTVLFCSTVSAPPCYLYH